MSGQGTEVDLPDSALRGYDVETTITEDGKVEFACPVCGRVINAEYIVTNNACPGGHDLDLILLQGDSAKRGPPVG